jgi:DHA2 family multidrug resistance protein
MAEAAIPFDPNSMIEYGARRVIITLTVILCTLLEIIDTTIVNVATNTLMGSLGATISEVSWVIAAYAIANVIVVPMSSWLSSQFGRKNYFAVSIALFTFASFMCGQSDSIWTLVFWRFVQGIGGGALLATSQSILVEIYPKEKIGIAMAMFGMGVIMGPTLGPVVGGFLVDNYDWPVIFLVNVPLGIIAFFLTLQFIRDNPKQAKPSGNIDWLGMFLLIVGIGSLQLVLEQGEREDWFDSTYITTFFFMAILGIIFFIIRELTAKNPIVDLSILRKGNVGIGAILNFVMGFTLFGTVFIIPLFVQRFLGFTATATGFMFMPGAIMSGMCMPLIGKLLQGGFNPKRLIIVGFSLTTIFVFWCSLILTSNTGIDNFFWPLIVRGIGMGFLFVPLSNLTLSGLDSVGVAQASGLTNMVRQIGGSISVALIGLLNERLGAQHKADLMVNISEFNPNFNERMNLLTQNFLRLGNGLEKAKQQALYFIEASVTKQSLILTYIDIFQYMAVFVLCCIPLVFIARTYKGAGPGPGAAH